MFITMNAELKFSWMHLEENVFKSVKINGQKIFEKL